MVAQFLLEKERVSASHVAQGQHEQSTLLGALHMNNATLCGFSKEFLRTQTSEVKSH